MSDEDGKNLPSQLEKYCKQWCEDVWYKMQDRWESLAALWPLGSPPAALPFLETRAHLPGTALVTQCTLSPGSSWSGGKGLAQRVMAEQVPPTSDSLDKSQTPEQAALVQFLSV